MSNQYALSFQWRYYRLRSVHTEIQRFTIRVEVCGAEVCEEDASLNSLEVYFGDTGMQRGPAAICQGALHSAQGGITREAAAEATEREEERITSLATPDPLAQRRLMEDGLRPVMYVCEVVLYQTDTVLH